MTIFGKQQIFVLPQTIENNFVVSPVLSLHIFDSPPKLELFIEWIYVAKVFNTVNKHRKNRFIELRPAGGL